MLKTYFYQEVGLHAFKIDINNTEKNAQTCRFQRWHSRLHISHPGGVYGQNSFCYKIVKHRKYTYTDECGSDVKVGLVVKLIGGRVWITNSITRANEMWARSPKLSLSWRTLHYPKVVWTKDAINVGTIVEVGTISAYHSLSEGDLDKI